MPESYKDATRRRDNGQRSVPLSPFPSPTTPIYINIPFPQAPTQHFQNQNQKKLTSALLPTPRQVNETNSRTKEAVDAMQRRNEEMQRSNEKMRQMMDDWKNRQQTDYSRKNKQQR